MKRFTRILFTALLALLVCASFVMAQDAESPAAPEGWKFDRKIIIVCPWGEGGGADSTLRALTPLIAQRLSASLSRSSTSPEAAA